jgi:hypothetical protein
MLRKTAPAMWYDLCDKAPAESGLLFVCPVWEITLR